MYSEIIEAIHQMLPKAKPLKRPVTEHRCGECDEVDRLLGGRLWTDVAADFPFYCHDVFPLLTEAAQLYYLPASMITALHESASFQGISLESALAPGGFETSFFTGGQCKAIVRWIETCWSATHGEEPRESLARRWSVAPAERRLPLAPTHLAP